jgi:hypothetical protein
MAENGHLGWRRSLIVQIDSASPSLEGFLLRITFHINIVFFGMLIAWMSEQVGQLAVVGEQNQPFAVQVQASYRVKVARQRYQITHRAMTACVVPCSGEDPERLVEDDIIERVICSHQSAIHRDLISFGVSPLA